MAGPKTFGGDRTGALRSELEQSPESLRFVPLARAYLARGDAALAEEICRKALAIRPNNALAWGFLGRALLGLGRLDEAEVALSHALAREKGDAELWRFMGELRLAQGLLGEGAAYLEAAANLAPDDAELSRELERVRALLWRESTGPRRGFASDATELDAKRVSPVDRSAPEPNPPSFGAGKTRKL